MSWIQKLSQTYDSQVSKNINFNDEKNVLLPISHTTQQAQIEIFIDTNGEFLRANKVPKVNATTIIPATESAAGRSGQRPTPYPLCDKLQYVAKDFLIYGGTVTSGFKNDPLFPHQNYLEQLQGWANSSFTHPKIEAVLKYVRKGQVVQDLVSSGVITLDEKGHFEKVKVLDQTVEQQDAFIRWFVEELGNPQSALHKDASLFQQWTAYYQSSNQANDFCYVTGQMGQLAQQHGKKIRNDGDSAKLISANDSSDFTFRGRFIDAKQAVGIGFEASQKAHNALRWLIRRQGYIRGELAIVAWTTPGFKVINPMEGSNECMFGSHLESDTEQLPTTAQALAKQLAKMISGYSVQLGSTTDVYVMGLDSATPGRLSITYYRELTNSEFLENLKQWHLSCAWFHRYHYKDVLNEKGKKDRKSFPFVGAPSPNDIAQVAYGSRIDDKLRKKTLERLLPCVLGEQRIPRDLVEAAVSRASNPVSMERYEWDKTLTIACALFRKFKIDYEKEAFDMALDNNRCTRDYLYGRLLALAESIEQWALKERGEKRATNAERLMQRFSDRPYSTWRTIELSLAPYLERLGSIANKRKALMDEIMTKFEAEEFLNDKRLSGEFLLGYHCQREDLWKKKSEEDVVKEDE